LIKRFSGNRYNYELTLDEDSNETLFMIRAVCKETGRFSSINNLNAMLGEFDLEPDNPEYEDSFWIIDRSRAEELFRTTECLLSDRQFVVYLEKRLDEDRMYGEWENVFRMGRFSNV